MEKRALLAVILSIAVFYVFSLFVTPEKKKSTPPVATDSVSAPSSTLPLQPLSNTQNAALPAKAADHSQASKQEITVDTDLFIAVFSSRGASLKSLSLKNYKEQNTPGGQAVILGTDADPAINNFSTRATGFNLQDNINYETSQNSLSVHGNDSRQITFNYISDQGFTVRKIYTLNGNSYAIKLDTQLFNNSQAPLAGKVQQILTYPAEPRVKDNRYDTAGSYLFSDNSLHVDKIKDVAGSSKRYDKAVQWAGFADKYFLTAILSESQSISSVELKKNAAGYFESIISSPQLVVNPGNSVTVTQRLFIGPKDLDILNAQGASLVQSLDLGWFTVLAKPLLYSLKFFYKYVGNYGIAIIIITLILKIIFFPLTHKSYKSMKDMQKLQPKMVALKEKFKNDRDAMNKAVMELYRENKVNPMGGCLPMIVQIPVFFALYKALMFSIELRHAPFMLWITDLADKDPYYVTPVVMGVTMFIQQKMTPSQMDPIQQKMMLALPVVFTFMFLSFPSGLVLYWLVNNILTIGQQMYINKLVKD